MLPSLVLVTSAVKLKPVPLLVLANLLWELLAQLVDLLTAFTVFAPTLLALASAALDSEDQTVLKLLTALDNYPTLQRPSINVVSAVEMANPALVAMDNSMVLHTMPVVSAVETVHLASTHAAPLLTALHAQKTATADGAVPLEPTVNASRETHPSQTVDAHRASSPSAPSSPTLSSLELPLEVVSLLL